MLSAILYNSRKIDYLLKEYKLVINIVNLYLILEGYRFLFYRFKEFMYYYTLYGKIKLVIVFIGNNCLSYMGKDGLKMKTRYVVSRDGAKIAYNITGKGQPLLLVHGGAGRYGKRLWEDTKWIDMLKEDYLIIAPDIRGYGESDKSEDSEFYSIDNILEDFNIILKECNVESFYYMGWSYGATIGFQMCKNNKSLKKAVCAGSCFGDYFFKFVAPRLANMYEELNYKKKNNALEEGNLSDEDKRWVEETNLQVLIAQYRAWEKWPSIMPSEVEAKVAIYSGTNDNKELLEQLDYQKKELEEYAVELKIFDNLNHYGLVSEVDTVMPWILEFFQGDD